MKITLHQKTFVRNCYIDNFSTIKNIASFSKLLFCIAIIITSFLYCNYHHLFFVALLSLSLYRCLVIVVLLAIDVKQQRNDFE